MRDIQLIFDDVYNLSVDIGNTDILERSPSYSNRSGDSQILQQGFIEVMHNALMALIDYATKPTTDNPYSAKEYVVFDSGFHGSTSEQQAEMNAYLDQGYKNNTFGDYKRPRGGYYNIGSAGLVQPIIEAGVNGSIDAIWHNGEFYTGGTSDSPRYNANRAYNDRFSYTDFAAVQDSSYFDPTLVKMERRPQIDAWFAAYDSILSEIKEQVYANSKTNIIHSYVEFDAQMSLTVRTDSSDKYNVRSQFYDDYWYDDLTGDSGQIVRQDVTLFREGDTQQGLFYQLYSESITYNVDNYEGGYDTVTLSTTANGSTFGDSLEVLHANAVNLLPNTHSYNLGLSHYRIDSEGVVNGVPYGGGVLERSGDGILKMSGNNIEEDHSLINRQNYNYISEQYTTRLYAKWNRYSTEIAFLPLNPADSPVTLIETRAKNTADAYNSYQASPEEVTIDLPDITEQSECSVAFFKTVDLEPLNDFTVVELTPA